jgi:two-component system cell cycle response regulator
VNDSKTLKLLVVEDNLEDEQLLGEALIEIEENRLWCNWRAAAIVQVEQLADALDCLRRDRFDAVLLNLSLPDSPALLDSYMEVDAWAQAAPIIVLADEPDDNLANRLLRAGAQDILLKSELDCAPLARSIQYAVERQRRVAAVQTLSLVDDLTSTLTRQGFLAVAEHYALLPACGDAELLLALLEISDFPQGRTEDRHWRELLLLRAAEALRSAFPPPALIGRIEENRFGLMTVGMDRTRLEALLHRAAAEIEEASWGGRHPAIVRFRLVDLGSHDLDQLLGSHHHPPFVDEHPPMKTVMLLD